MMRRLALMILLAAAVTGSTAAQEKAEPLRLSAGETALELNRHLLEDLGLEAVFRQVTGEAGGFVRAVFPAVAPPALRLRAPGGSFEGLDGGLLRHEGGFDLAWDGGGLSLAGFELVPASADAWETALFDLRAADGSVPFFLDGAHSQHLPDLGQFVFLNMDLRLTEAFARRLGRPELAGAAVGSADVRTQLAAPLAPPAEGAACVPDFAGDVDVELIDLYGLGEVEHDDDRVAMSAAAELRNSGVADVEWYRPIDPDGGGGPVVGPHPYLALSLYRLADGTMRQIGRADVKHAFFAVNDDCPCPGDQILYDGCSDLYAAVTNYNRMNLAPRHEVTASTGAWESLGSHFDGDPVDDYRHHQGEGASHPDGFEHRLTAAVEDLLVPGARYFIEAWYVTAGDVDIFNSMGRREVDPQPGDPWLFPTIDAGLTQGSTLDAWVDSAAPPPGTTAVILDTGEGHLELASATAPGAAGVYRYDYGLMNFDFDRRIRSFSVPLPTGVQLAGVSFHDGDPDPGNDWLATVTASEIVWSTPAGDPGLNALDWGTLYSFRFEANAAPAAVDPSATMQVLEAGSPGEHTEVAKGPGATLVPVHRLEVVAAGSGAGEVTSTPAGIGCGADCDELYAPDTPVELAAAAEAGSALIRWTEGGATVGTADTQDTVLDVDRSLTAVFELCDRALEPQTVDDVETFEACDVLRAGAGFVVGATGEATLRAGSGLVLDDGFSMQPGGQLATEIDPSLLP